MSLDDTIAAIATAPGRGALAVVRVSGPGVADVAVRVGLGGLEPRRATLRRLTHPETGRTVDRVVATWFAAPSSYTAEEMLEVGCHGGSLGPQLVLDAILAAGARVAQPGEFTRRALLNGKLDLLQAEAVLDLVDATSPAMRSAALHQVERGLSDRIGRLRGDLLRLQAMLAYDIDFPEEGDGPLLPERICEATAEVRERLAALAREGKWGGLLREGALTVIAGRPNVGKSSLFNALLGVERAIVTAAPGTTRDAIEAAVSFDGYPFRLVDTAGLRERPERIERLGIEVAHRYIREADIVLLCAEAGRRLGTDERAFLQASRAADRSVIVVWTKGDQEPGLSSATGDTDGAPGEAGVRVVRLRVSAHTGQGMTGLREALVDAAFGGIRRHDVALVTRARHTRAVRAALEQVDAFRHAWEAGASVEIAATHLLAATGRLEEVLGLITDEDVLDALFADYCVGK